MSKRSYKDSRTKPIQLLLDANLYISEYTKVVGEISKLGVPTKGCRGLLGRQHECWVGGSQNRRFYIWKIEELWILAHNTAGVIFEVDADISTYRARELWDNFMKKIG